MDRKSGQYLCYMTGPFHLPSDFARTHSWTIFTSRKAHPNRLNYRSQSCVRSCPYRKRPKDLPSPGNSEQNHVIKPCNWVGCTLLMVGELSNPFSTGSGGSNFEGKVQGAFVATMILGGACPCLPHGVIDSIRLQSKQAGYDTDDALVTVATVTGTRHRLLCQIKHGVTFTKSDEAFVQTLLSAWRDFNTPDRYVPEHDAIAIATGPQSAKVIDHVRPLLEWARHCNSAAEFISKVDTKDFSSGPKREFIDTVRSILSKADPPPADDTSLWRFLRALHLLSYDFDVQHSQHEAMMLTMLAMAKARDCTESPQGLWTQILDLTRDFNQTAGTITRQTLESALTPALKQAFPGSARILQATSLVRLKEHSEYTLQRISSELVAGVSLERRFVIDRAVDLLEQSQVLVITGDAGDGKSVVAKLGIKRVADDGTPVFCFRVEEFDEPHIHQALTKMGVQDNLSTLSARFTLLPRKVLFVDSVERLFELQSRDAFAQLLSAIATDPTWRVILACRIQAVDLLVNHLLAPASLSVGTLKVPRLEDAELNWVAERVPQIKPYLDAPRLVEILRTPLYLRIACNASGDLLKKQAGLTASFDIAQVFWRDAVEKPSEQQDGLPMRRGNVFVEIAVRRAKRMQAFVPVHDLDPEVVQKLESDGLLARDEHGFYAPSQDLLEDWALRSHVARHFHEANGDWARFFENVGAEPALRRAFRIWLTNAIAGQDSARIADFVVDVSRNAIVPQHWRDEVLVGVMLSDSADILIDRIGPALLANDKALLIRTIHLLRTACKGPNETFMKLLGDAGRRVNPFLAVTFTSPRGRGWAALIKFIGRNSNGFGLQESSLLHGFLSDWAVSLDLNAALPPEATDCAKLSLKYFHLLTEENVLGHDLAGKYLEILFKMPQALPDEITALYAPPPAKASSPPSREWKTRLLDEHAIKSLQCMALCRHFPKIVLEVLERTVWQGRSRDSGYRLDVDEYFGLSRRLHMEYFPASALQGPFFHLLTWHPDTAVPYLILFVERAAATYAQSGLDGKIPRVPLRLGNGQERVVLASIRLWCLYRGTQVGPHIVESALMALEHWLFSLVDGGKDISHWVQMILEHTRSVAPLAVLASIATAAPKALGENVLPLLSTLDLYAYDMRRCLLDTQHTGDLRSSLGIPTGGLQDIYYNERKQSDAKPHRKSHLEHLAVRLQMGPLRPRIASSIDDMKSELGKQAKPLVEDQLILKRIDVREYEAVDETAEGVVMQVKMEEPEIRTAVEAGQKQQQHLARIMQLQNWAMKSWEKAEEGKGFPDWRAALSEAQEVDRLSTEGAAGTTDDSDINLYDHRSLRVLAYSAACLIRDHRRDLDKDQLAWCFRQLREAIDEHANSTDSATQVGVFSMHGSRPAAAVLPLLLDVCDGEEQRHIVRTMIATALTHAVDEVRRMAAAGVRAWLWERDSMFAERCFHGLIDFAALREQALEAYRRDRGPESFDERSRSLSRELQTRLTSSDAAIPAVASVSLKAVIPEDLLDALRLVPADRNGTKFAKLFAEIMLEVVNAEAAHRSARSRDREPLNYEFRGGFATLFAEFMHSQEIEACPELLEALKTAVERGPDVAADVLQQLLYREDQAPSGERFWTIWKRCAEVAFQDQVIRGSSRRYGFDERHKLVRTLLFAQAEWKEGLKTWSPLQQHQDFMELAFERVGDTPTGFEALTRLLRTAGQFLLPQALKDLDDAHARFSDEAVLEEGARYELELLLRDCVLSMGTQIRSREVLRKATLNLLDYLVNKGSSLAFQLRELLVAPIRTNRSFEPSG